MYDFYSFVLFKAKLKKKSVGEWGKAHIINYHSTHN